VESTQTRRRRGTRELSRSRIQGTCDDGRQGRVAAGRRRSPCYSPYSGAVYCGWGTQLRRPDPIPRFHWIPVGNR